MWDQYISAYDIIENYQVKGLPPLPTLLAPDYLLYFFSIVLFFFFFVFFFIAAQIIIVALCYLLLLQSCFNFILL